MNKVIDGIKNDLLAIPKSIKEKARDADAKKLLLKCAPYLIFGYVFNKLSWLYRHERGTNVFQKALYTLSDMGKAFHNPLPSLKLIDIVIGIVSGFCFFLIVYCKRKNAKKFRHGEEYGSARWGTPKDIAPYIDPVFENNVILTETERLMMSGRPKLPKYARNRNILVIGDSVIIGLS